MVKANFEKIVTYDGKPLQKLNGAVNVLKQLRLVETFMKITHLNQNNIFTVADMLYVTFKESALEAIV